MLYAPNTVFSQDFSSATGKTGLTTVTKKQEAHRVMLELFVKFSYLFWIGIAPPERYFSALHTAHLP